MKPPKNSGAEPGSNRAKTNFVKAESLQLPSKSIELSPCLTAGAGVHGWLLASANSAEKTERSEITRKLAGCRRASAQTCRTWKMAA